MLDREKQKLIVDIKFIYGGGYHTCNGVRHRVLSAFCYLPFDCPSIIYTITCYIIRDIDNPKDIYTSCDTLYCISERPFVPVDKILKRRPDIIKKVLSILNKSYGDSTREYVCEY